MRSTLICFTLLILLFILSDCRRRRNDAYTRDERGFYYKLLAFESDEQKILDEGLYKIAVAFRNQRDSVFWDSYNNFGDFFILRSDSQATKKILHLALRKFNVGDSGSLLIASNDFFKQQFNFDKVPFFSAHDSVVKVNFRIGGPITPEGLINLQNNLVMRERNKISDVFGSPGLAERNRDPLGFYWLEKPEKADTSALAKYGNRVVFNYEGAFLNGRFLERSPENFEMILGTPDQVLKGLNYVIQKLKIGQTAKIILPSQLAFGDEGSSNGTVPPFTPLVFQVKLIDIKR